MPHFEFNRSLARMLDHRKLHRWVGLASVIFLAFIALTGIGLHYMAWWPSRRWVTMIQQVHTGAFLGAWGPYLYDAISFGIVVLGVTGVVVWYRGRQPVEKKEPAFRESDLFGDEGIFTMVWESGLKDEHLLGRVLTWCRHQKKRRLFERLLIHGDLEVREGRVWLADNVQSVTLAHLRRHRLAERMLADWWGWDPEVLHDGVDQIEPVLSEEVEDGVCSLLGHPKLCPHGSPIPVGNCCGGQQSESVKSLVEAGTSGTASLVFAKVEQAFIELVRIGALPGSQVRWTVGPEEVVVSCGDQETRMDLQTAQSILVTAS